MNILLTGGAGYIGSHTLIELDKAGHSVVVVDNFYNSQPEAIRRVEKIIGHKVTLIEADIRDHEAMDKVFSSHKIDAVINFAGLKAVGESVVKPLMYYETKIVKRNIFGIMFLYIAYFFSLIGAYIVNIFK